jgi:coatomer protein complex subunit alpha (xenin)
MSTVMLLRPDDLDPEEGRWELDADAGEDVEAVDGEQEAAEEEQEEREGLAG